MQITSPTAAGGQVADPALGVTVLGGGEVQVQEYLDTEGTYWVHRQRRLVLPAEAAHPRTVLGARMMWRLKAPPLPIDRELVTREAMHPVP